ncbi:MAG: GlxA family transcriptional regulator [Segniliparus sp.]|uniref:GlxA family transcriptional regulator n=1 Tax=Segniliparus sp. TaxID=2804064 RepID=UPI003F3BC070
MPKTANRPHRVVALALPGVVLLDLAAPAHLFGHCGEGKYAFELAGLSAGPAPDSTGVVLCPKSGLTALEGADTVVVPGCGVPGLSFPEEAVEALRTAHARGARVMSVCTGAFLLAEAGLLDGRRATTHWMHTEELARRYPKVTTVPDVLFVDEGRILTSAGVAAGLDLCLHVVRRDHGAAHAAEVARRTVIAPHREGGQAQYIEQPVPQRPEDSLADIRQWAIEHLSEPIAIADMARRALLSTRSFQRKFVAETATSPGAWLLRQRVAAAQRLLAETSLGVDEVANAVGLGSAEGLRQHFRKQLRTTPTAYRRAFAG